MYPLHITGDKIEADYRGKGKYYPGKISRLRLNGEYDIDYDDGSSEPNVPPNRIHKLGGRSRSPDLKSGDKGDTASLLHPHPDISSSPTASITVTHML